MGQLNGCIQFKYANHLRTPPPSKRFLKKSISKDIGFFSLAEPLEKRGQHTLFVPFMYMNGSPHKPPKFFLSSVTFYCDGACCVVCIEGRQAFKFFVL